MPLLPFAQLDLAGELELAPGRYLVRPQGDPGADPDVLAIRVLGAERSRSRLRRRKPVPLAAEPGATPLPLSRLTMVKASPFESEAAARAWLDRVSGDDALARGLTTELTRTANRAVLAHRVAARDPYAAEIDAARAVAVRFGYGSGEEVAEGRWSAAHELSERRRRSLRSEIVDGAGAQERVAAVLGGREAIGAAEEILSLAERAASEQRAGTAALLLSTAVESAAREGTDTAAAGDQAAALRERALSGAEIDPEALQSTLLALRRALRDRD